MCSQEEQIQWFKDTIGPKIAQVALSGDMVQEIVVADDLYDVAVTALSDMPLPAIMPDQEGITRDQLERDWRVYCGTNIIARTATIEQLALQEEVSPEVQFIRLQTAKGKFKAFLDNWDRSIGFSAYLQQRNVPFDYSLEDKKFLYGLSALFDCMAQTSARMMSAQGSDDVELYQGD